MNYCCSGKDPVVLLRDFAIPALGTCNPLLLDSPCSGEISMCGAGLPPTVAVLLSSGGTSPWGDGKGDGIGDGAACCHFIDSFFSCSNSRWKRLPKTSTVPYGLVIVIFWIVIKMEGVELTIKGGSVIDTPKADQGHKQSRQHGVVEPQGTRQHGHHSIEVLDEHKCRLLQDIRKRYDDFADRGFGVALAEPSEGCRTASGNLLTATDLENSISTARSSLTKCSYGDQ